MLRSMRNKAATFTEYAVLTALLGGVSVGTVFTFSASSVAGLDEADTAVQQMVLNEDPTTNGGGDAGGGGDTGGEIVPPPPPPPSQVVLDEADLRFLVVQHDGPNPPGVRWVRLRATPNGPHPVDYGKICSYKIDGVVDFTGYVPVWEGIPTTRLSGEFPEIVGLQEGVARPNWWASDVFGMYTPFAEYGVVVAYSTWPSNPILTALECNRL